MFREWDSFYLLIGSASGALIGLLFVVVTLTTGLERSTATRGQSIYMTPTVFHFGVVLVISAVGTAPRVAAPFAAVVIGACAAAGFVRTAAAAAQIRGGKVPVPAHWSDFWWYGAGPGVIYLALGATAAAVWAAPAYAACALAPVLVALLLIGIRNAWDLVTWLAPRAPDA